MKIIHRQQNYNHFIFKKAIRGLLQGKLSLIKCMIAMNIIITGAYNTVLPDV
jgi:hypothetical protein